MNSSGSNRLLALAQQLRLYQPPPEAGESATPIAGNPDRFRPKRAAVLICIFEGDSGEFRVILTKRSSRLSTHSGEVSLPGGKADESDKDDGDTATREAKEEIGLDPSLVDVITVMEPFLSKVSTKLMSYLRSRVHVPSSSWIVDLDERAPT
ncbi:Nudix hydrolase 15, mitochondrial [Linum perenne]